MSMDKIQVSADYGKSWLEIEGRVSCTYAAQSLSRLVVQPRDRTLLVPEGLVAIKYPAKIDGPVEAISSKYGTGYEFTI